MSRPQTINEALSDLPSFTTDAFSKLHIKPKPLLRTRLLQPQQQPTVNSTHEDDKQEDRSDKARFQKYADGWTPERRTAWSLQRTSNRGVKEAVIAGDGEVVQSIEFDSTPRNPFLEARSAAIERFKDTTSANRNEGSLDAGFLEESDHDEEKEGISPSFLEDSPPHTELIDDGDEDLPSAFVEFLRQNMDKATFNSSEKRRNMPPADFALLWRKSGRGGVSNRMIVAQQAFFAGEDLQAKSTTKHGIDKDVGDSPSRKKRKGKEREVVELQSKGSPVKAKPKGNSASQKQMDRLLHGKKR